MQQKDDKKILWHTLAFMAFSTVWGCGNVINGFSEYGGLKAIVSWILIFASYFVPFGYYIPLSAYEVANWDEATHTVTYGTRPFNWGLLAFTLALGAVLFALAWRKVQDEEV